MHGQYAKILKSEKTTKFLAWLSSIGLKEMTQSLIVAAPD